MAHICTAIDYKDNDKLLEDHVNHMAGNTLRADGVCVKLVTRPGESLPGVYVEDRNRNVLQTNMLDGSSESHFAGRCQECEVRGGARGGDGRRRPRTRQLVNPCSVPLLAPPRAPAAAFWPASPLPRFPACLLATPAPLCPPAQPLL